MMAMEPPSGPESTWDDGQVGRRWRLTRPYRHCRYHMHRHHHVMSYHETDISHVISVHAILYHVMPLMACHSFHVMSHRCCYAKQRPSNMVHAMSCHGMLLHVVPRICRVMFFMAGHVMPIQIHASPTPLVAGALAHPACRGGPCSFRLSRGPCATGARVGRRMHQAQQHCRCRHMSHVSLLLLL